MGTLTSADKPMAPAAPAGVDSNLSNINQFLSLISGNSETTSGGTTVKQTNVTPAGITQMMQQMLEGTGGLADLAMGAHTAGVYGDTTTPLLAQNLLTKIAGTAAEANATTTTTTPPITTKVAPKLNASSALTSLALAGIAKAGSVFSKKIGLTDALGLGDDKAAAVSGGATPTIISAPLGAESQAGQLGVSGADAINQSFVPAIADASAQVANPADVIDSLATSGTDTTASSFGSDAIDSSFAGGASSVASDVAPVAADGGSDIGDFLSSLFSRGGRVRVMPPKGTVKGYASGGLVNGDMPAPNVTPSTPTDVSSIIQGLASNVISAGSLPVGVTRNTSGAARTSGSSKDITGNDSAIGGAASPTPNGVGAPGKTPSFGDVASIAGMLAGIVANPVVGLAGAVSMMGTGKGLASNAISLGADALGLNEGPPGTGMSSAGSSSAGSSGAAMSTDGPATVDVGAPNIDPGVGFDVGATADNSSSSGGEEVAGFGGGVDSSGSGTGESEGGGMSGGDSSGGDGSGMVDGGQISAPGTGSTDTRFIKAADDEFVLNANAARAIGYDKLNWLNTVLGGSVK